LISTKTDLLQYLLAHPTESLIWHEGSTGGWWDVGPTGSQNAVPVHARAARSLVVTKDLVCRRCDYREEVYRLSRSRLSETQNGPETTTKVAQMSETRTADDSPSP
jgi:hypothetical protein